MNTAQRRAFGTCAAAVLVLHAGWLLPGGEPQPRFGPAQANPVVALRLVEPGGRTGMPADPMPGTGESTAMLDTPVRREPFAPREHAVVMEPSAPREPPAPREPSVRREPAVRTPAQLPPERPNGATRADAAAAVAPEHLPADAAPDPPPRQSAPTDGAAAASAEPPPIYPTRVPPSARLRYALWRGGRPGSAELIWQADGGRYSARFEARLDGDAPWIEQASDGTIDAAGIAPQRFTDRRQRRIAAANFRRDRGVVAWSGASGEVPLLAGAQDRLSWIAQLAAVVAAEPMLADAGARIALPVAGARGDASVWVFVAEGRQPDGTLHFRRDRAGPYDLAVEVWLDPARDHWPSRLCLEPGADARARVELALRSSPP